MASRHAIEELYEKAIKYACKSGHKEIAGDFAGWIATKWLSGTAQHQTLGQSLVDFLRLEYGGSGVRCGADALLRSRRKDIALQDDEDSYEEALERLRFHGHIENGVGMRLECNQFHLGSTEFLTDREAQVWEMKTTLHSISHKEIAAKFQCTESNVSHILNRCRKKILNELGIKMMRERIQEGKTALHVDWIVL